MLEFSKVERIYIFKCPVSAGSSLLYKGITVKNIYIRFTNSPTVNS